MILYRIMDGNRQTNDLHNILDALSAVEGAVKCAPVQGLGFDRKLHAVDIPEPVKDRLETLVGEIIITRSPGGKLTGIYLREMRPARQTVVDQLLVGP